MLTSTLDPTNQRRKYQSLSTTAAAVLFLALGCGGVSLNGGGDAAAGAAGELGGREGGADAKFLDAAGSSAADSAAAAGADSEASETSDATTLSDGRCAGCMIGGHCVTPDDVTTCGRNGEPCQAVQSPLVCAGTQGGCDQNQEAATRRACDYTSGTTSIRVYQVCCPANVCDVEGCSTPCMQAGQPCPS